ncbi:Ferredoxin [Frankia canadensis]|uniref:Ferredoxin n=1 Tax=Frankia canadensis TaxID=1836972 RepID=A0A2I2KRQ4_9ACTN|nr:ferredoxin [Frankia canadensis]SNQ48345.1 Ferredoxin [Frankia canadensis]SOU55635.1 Ferredoxin [Frankia canadensis]
MRIRVAGELCMGHGLCAMRAPEVFELSELGTNEMAEFEVPAGLAEQARGGVLACPEQIISIIEDAPAS